MKLARLLLLGAFLAIVIPPVRAWSATTNASDLGEQFVDLLARGDFASAAARYDKEMQAALPEPKLRDTRRSVEDQAGAFKKRILKRAER